ncbi:hypothetical protein, partial [Leptospira santarosai]|uniref:hypothetical protein n=1 Tax=Leptospira santarosai TaxID=28183 RepID=UPI0024AEB26F
RRIGIIAQRIPVLSTSVFFPILSEQEIGSYSELHNGCPKFCFKMEIGLKMNGTLFCSDE